MPNQLPNNAPPRVITPPISKDTRLCISLSARPGNFGTRLHNFLYARLNLDFVYKAFTTTDLPAAVAGIRALGIRGCAISMPFKQAVIPLLDSLDESASRIGAVNTIVNDLGKLRGLNTDEIAIRRIIEDRRVPKDALVTLAGSGGMARAVASALHAIGRSRVTIRSRNEPEGRALAERYSFAWRPWAEPEPDADVLINATPLGMAPDVAACPLAEPAIARARLVVDCVSIPIETTLIRSARRVGAEVVTGFDITVLQSLEQFTLYTGVQPDAESVAAACNYLRSFE